MINLFQPITNKWARSMQFGMNDYLALLVTLLIIHVRHLNQNSVNMLMCLRGWLSEGI